MTRILLRICFTVLPLGVLVLLFFVVSLTNQLADMSTNVRDIDERIDTLKEQNENYMQKIASASSLFTLEVKAKEQGFTEPAKTSFVALGSDKFPVALNQPH